ncbi:hypothetical protein STEG23_004272 [Scotinomys teguina]
MCKSESRITSYTRGCGFDMSRVCTGDIYKILYHLLKVIFSDGFCFIYIARASSTILNKYDKSGQPCLVPHSSGIALSFSPFNLMVAVGFLLIAFIMFSMKNIGISSS